MYALRRNGLIGLVLLLGVWTAACERGSSGFDISENAVIVRVLETQQCNDSTGLTLCPADQKPPATPGTATPTAPQGPTATPIPEPSPRVDTRLANGASIACTRAQAGEPCRLTFSFSGLGFPPATAFRVAARLRAPDSVWAIAGDPVPNPSLDPPGYDSEVELDVPDDALDPRTQFAVLAYLDGVADPPSSMSELSVSGADFAFVTPELVLEVIDLAPPPTATPTEPSPEPTPSEATATATVSPTATATTSAAGGPVVTYFGLARADNFSLAPSGFDAANRPIFVRPLGSSFSIIVEGRPGDSGLHPGPSAFVDASTLPDLQLIVDRALGDGSPVVCDRQPPTLGGVPATVPFAFSTDAATVAAINDLGCRVDDGLGRPLARQPSNACTTDRSGDYRFVDATSTAQFCLLIAGSWEFHAGDTTVAVRLRDRGGNLGPVREMIVRVAEPPPPTPTATFPFLTPATRTATPSPDPSAPTAAASATPTPTATRRNTSTPGTPGLGPVITHFGIARADDRPLSPIGTDAEGRPIYQRRLGSGLSIIVEAAPGVSRRNPGHRAYDPVEPPDLQVLVSRPLGNGSRDVCDAEPPLIGGVPGFDPLVFVEEPNVIDAFNDFGCRVDDGQGNPFARRAASQACTRDDSAEFSFVSGESTIQYCLPIAQSWNFPLGDTIVAARVRDEIGHYGPVSQIVVRIRP